MRLNHKSLLARLTQLGWEVEHHGYRYTYVRHPDGRSGEIPYASQELRGRYFSRPEWDRIKRALRLQGEEIHG